MIQEITDDSLAAIVASNKKVMVQYTAGWCGNCRIMKPKFKKFSNEHEDMVFVLVDAENNPDSRKMAEVDNLPTFAAFVEGEFKKQVQTNKMDVLKELVDEVAIN